MQVVTIHSEGDSNVKWIEMIRLRSCVEEVKRAMTIIGEQRSQIKRETSVSDVIVLNNKLVEGDLAVILSWENDRQPVRTREGLLVAEELSKIGMVDHSVWADAPGFEEQMEKMYKLAYDEKESKE